MALALLAVPLAVVAAEDPPVASASGRIATKAGQVAMSKRHVVCALGGTADAPPLGAVLEEPGQEVLDAAGMTLRSIVRRGPQGYAITAGTGAFSGGLFTAGTDVLLAGLDNDFNPQWATVFGGPLSDTPSSMTATADGGFAVVSETRSLWFSTLWRWTAEGRRAALLSKYAADGALEWAQYHTPGDEVQLSAIVAPDSGGIVFGGVAWRNRWAGFLIRLNDKGEHQWAREIGLDYENGISWIAKARDGSLLLSGSRRVVKASKFEVWVAKVGDNGDVLWARSYQTDVGGSTGFITATDDGGAIVVRTAESAGSPAHTRVPVFALDPQGEVRWSGLYEFEERVNISAVAESSAGHYLLFGGAYRNDAVAGPVTLTVDRVGRVIRSQAVTITQAASTPATLLVTQHDPVSVLRDPGRGFVIMAAAMSGPSDLMEKAKTARTKAEFTDEMQSKIKRQLYFVRVNEDGQTGTCSRPVAVDQRPLTVTGLPMELPSREIPPERSTFIPRINLGVQRIGPP